MDWRERPRREYLAFDEDAGTVAVHDDYANAVDDDLREPGTIGRGPWQVCPDCEGNGTCVNPAVDAHGITPEEFAEDPDFAEAYHGGRYDITCPACKGLRVTRERFPTDDHARRLFEWAAERAA